MEALFSSLATGSPISDDGVLSGVSMITEGESRGWDMTNDSATLASVLDASTAFKGGLKVKLGHVNDAGAIVGVLNNSRIEGKQVKADLSLFPEHQSYGLVMRLAKTVPDQIGLSIHFKLKTDTINGVKYARCQELYSCDLVDNPAANPGGLFSAINGESTMPESTPETATPPEAKLETDTPSSDSQTSLKDVVDQLVKRIDAIETRLGSLEESDQADSAGAADYEAKLAALETNGSAVLTLVGGLKETVTALQSKLSEMPGLKKTVVELQTKLAAVEADRKTTAETASALLNQLGETVPVDTKPLAEPGSPEKLIDYKMLEASHGFERVKLARKLETKYGENWKAEFTQKALPG